MSVTPNEIITMKEPINIAKGKVLTLGCGLGYYAYMVSIKEDVESVTIIENSDEVIELFEINILSQFKNKEKINIIKADAIEYMKLLDDGEFDYCFADIWISNTYNQLYIELKKLHHKFKLMKMDYWIEDDILAYIMGTFNLYINFTLQQHLGYNPNVDFKDLFIGLPVLNDAVYVAELFKDFKVKNLQEFKKLYEYSFLLSKMNE